MTPEHRIREIQRFGYSFPISKYLQRGFELFGKQAGFFIAFTLVYFLIMALTNVMPFVGPLAASIILAPGLSVGYALVAHKIAKGQERIEFKEFYQGFDHTGSLAGVTVLTFLMLGAAAVPFVASMFISDFQDVSPLFAVLLLPVLYFAIAYAAAPLFVVFYKMQAWQAMEASRKVITKNWFMVFLMAIVMALMAGMGTMLFFVGLLVAMPVIACTQYAAFADIMKLSSDATEDVDDEILRHLV